MMALLYWVDWAMVQYCHCWVWFAPVTRVGAACYHPSNFVGSICQDCWGGGEINKEDILIFYSDPTGGIIYTVEVYLTLSFTITFLDPFNFLAVWPSFLSVCTCVFSWFFFMLWHAAIAGGLGYNIGKRLRPVGGSRQFDLAFISACGSSLVFWTILVYYKFYYQDAGTYKPSWLDWFG